MQIPRFALGRHAPSRSLGMTIGEGLRAARLKAAPFQSNRLWGVSTLKPFKCTTMVYTDAMAVRKRVRRSVTLPPEVAKEVDTMAKKRRLSDNRVLVELIEQGIEARKQREKAFFELAERLRVEMDPEQVKRLGDELGRMV